MIKKIPPVETEYLIYVCDNCKKEERAQVTPHGSQVKPATWYSLAASEFAVAESHERLQSCSKKCNEQLSKDAGFELVVCL